MNQREELWYYILDKLSLELSIQSFLKVLEYNLLDYDLEKMTFKFVIRDHIFDIENLIIDILSEKTKCDKYSLDIILLDNKEDSKINFRESSSKYQDALINMYTYHQSQDFLCLNLVYIKYYFLRQVSLICWQNFNFGYESYLLSIWWYVFNSFESAFTQLGIRQDNPNIKKKYKSGILLIFAICFSLADGDDGSWNCWIWLEISLSRIKDAFLLITKEGFFGIEWLLEKRIPKKSITMVDCDSANAIFIKCGLWYRFKLQNWFIKILMKN